MDASTQNSVTDNVTVKQLYQRQTILRMFSTVGVKPHQFLAEFFRILSPRPTLYPRYRTVFARDIFSRD